MYVFWKHACMDVLWEREMYGCIGVHACAHICVFVCVSPWVCLFLMFVSLCGLVLITHVG